MAKKTTSKPTSTQETHTHADGTVHAGPAHDHAPADDLLVASTALDLTVPWTEIEPVYNEVLLQMSKRVKSAGFRPGKVPTVVAKDIIGEEKLKDETAQRLLPNAYGKLMKTSGKQPLTQPEISAKKMDLGSDWEFTVFIAEKPEISIKDHQKVVKAAKKEAEKEIAAATKAEKSNKDDKAEPQAPEGQKPDPEAEKREKTLQAIFKALITEYKPRVPELLLKQETRAELDEMVRNLEQIQMKLDDYLARRQITFEQLTGEVATQILGRLQLDLLYSAMIDDQKLDVTEADVDKFLERIPDKAIRDQQRQDERYLSYIKTLILRDKVSEYLLNV